MNGSTFFSVVRGYSCAPNAQNRNQDNKKHKNKKKKKRKENDLQNMFNR